VPGARPAPARVPAGARKRTARLSRVLAGSIVALVVFLVLGGFSLRSRAARRSPVPADAGLAAPLPDAPSTAEQGLLRAAEAAGPDDPVPARRLGDFYADSARPLEALWAYALALHAQPADTPATLGLARALEQGLLLDAAMARLRELLSREPGQPEASAMLAELSLRTGKPEAALAVVQGATREFRESTAGAVLDGRVRQALGDATGAKAAYRRAVEQDSRDTGAWHRLGLLALSQGWLYDARQALGAARVLAPTNTRYSVDFGRSYAASPKPEEWREAPRYYVEAMNRSREFAPAHYEAGLWYERQARWSEALERFQTAVNQEPGDPDAREHLARALEGMGRVAEAHHQRGIANDARDLRAPALLEYQAWAAKDPTDPEAPLQVGQSYFKMELLERARAVLVQALRRHRRHAGIRERLIAFHLLAGDRAAARHLCDEWLREQPGAPRAHFMLGRAAADEQQWTEAVRLYEQALASEPESPEFLGALGEALLKLPGTAETPRAIAVLGRAVVAAPDEARWRTSLAGVLKRAGRIADARRQALRSLDLDPHQGAVYTMVVQLARQERAAAPLALYAPLVRAVEARLREEGPLWRASWQRPRDPAAYDALARFLIATGDLGAAEGQLAEAARLRPDSAELRARLAQVRRLRQVVE
jgi:tetratricopeptide (TPR) repeat protein